MRQPARRLRVHGFAVEREPETVSLDGTTEDGTAATGDLDYQPLAALPITFSPGSTETVMSVTVNGDAGFEPGESFALKLADPSNATIADDTGLGTIQNDDAQPQVSLDDVSTLEGNQGQTDVTFTVSLASPSTQTITVDYETKDGAATAGSDYDAGSGLLTFDPGQTSEASPSTPWRRRCRGPRDLRLEALRRHQRHHRRLHRRGHDPG